MIDEGAEIGPRTVIGAGAYVGAGVRIGDDWDSLVDADRVSQTNDLRAVVPEVTTPTLIIHGDGDVITSVDGSKRLLSSLPNGELAILDGVGHAPMITAPDRVAAAITTFLTRIEI